MEYTEKQPYICVSKGNEADALKTNKMNTYTVNYSGNAIRYKNFERTVNADSEREAVEDVYRSIMDENYFPQEDGSIKDCDGHTVAEGYDSSIEYDGGFFSAELVEDEEEEKDVDIEIFFDKEDKVWRIAENESYNINDFFTCKDDALKYVEDNFENYNLTYGEDE